ncbi:MAG: tol-pal system protein YbgF [Myxococcota bacterium]
MSRHTSMRITAWLLCAGLSTVATGCLTVGDFRREMADFERRMDAKVKSSHGTTELADLASGMDEMRTEMRALKGRLEVAEKTAADALAEARRARQELAARSAAESGAGPGGAVVATGEDEEPRESEELVAYRGAYAKWRAGEHQACIDQFAAFLKDYPASSYADDAAFWMADCHFQQGEFKSAVMRFDDVVNNYPTGNKAPEALYRQGESLLRLGPGFTGAAKRAFERVVEEYPDSARAPEAAKQIKLLRAG